MDPEEEAIRRFVEEKFTLRLFVRDMSPLSWGDWLEELADPLMHSTVESTCPSPLQKAAAGVTGIGRTLGGSDEADIQAQEEEAGRRRFDPTSL